MIIPTKVGRFPKLYHDDIEELLSNIAIAYKSHDEEYQHLLEIHFGRSSKDINAKTFEVLEKYSALVDSINCYCDYLTKNDLTKYLVNG